MENTIAEAQAKAARGEYLKIEPGVACTFYAEMQQEYLPAEERMRRFTGTQVEVLRVNEDSDWFEPYDKGDGELIEPEVSKSFIVRAHDGTEFVAMEEELNGWDYDLDQFFWHDGTHGKAHTTTFLGNEK